MRANMTVTPIRVCDTPPPTQLIVILERRVELPILRLENAIGLTRPLVISGVLDAGLVWRG